MASGRVPKTDNTLKDIRRYTSSCVFISDVLLNNVADLQIPCLGGFL